MKKSMLNLGRALNRTEQKQINGGFVFDTPGDVLCDRATERVPLGCPCSRNSNCGPNAVCSSGYGGVCEDAY